VDQVPVVRDGALPAPTWSRTLNVCPKCAHHHRIGARARLDAFLDAEGRYEIGQEVLPVDALKFQRQPASTRSA
jgi:acetyl-CoA carboxylase carboxyl transferase subunit beta